MNESTQKPKLFSFKNFFHDFVRVTGAPVALWYRPKRIYTCEKARKIPKGGLLLIANHTDFADPVYMMLGVWQRRQYFLVSEELMDGPHGRLFKACRCIRIDRDNPGVSTFREITQRLKSGECVSMFPEGKIAADSTKPSPFKSGAVLMAIRSGVPIIPMYIEKKKSAFGRLRIVIGESVDVRAMYGERPTFAQIDAATKLLFEREQSLSSRLEK